MQQRKSLKSLSLKKGSRKKRDKGFRVRASWSKGKPGTVTQ